MPIENSYGSGVTLRQVRSFVAVARCGSFSAAALELGVSQASLSYAVDQLERTLGVRLLSRGSYGARLNREGERIFEDALNLLRAEVTFIQGAGLSHGILEGSVRVAAFPSIAQFLLPRAIKRLRVDYPNVRVEPVDVATSSSDVLKAIEGGHADIGLVVAQVHASYFQWKLFDDPFVVCVPQTVVREDLDWEDLGELPLIAYDKDWSDGCVLGMRYAMDRLGVEEAYRIRDTGVVLSMVAEGLGYTVLPELTLGRLPDGVARLGLELPVARSVSVAVPVAGLRVPSNRAFLNVLRECLPRAEVPLLEVWGASLQQPPG